MFPITSADEQSSGSALLPGYSSNSHLQARVSRCSFIHTHTHTHAHTPPHIPGSWANGAKALGLVLHELTLTHETRGWSSRAQRGRGDWSSLPQTAASHQAGFADRGPGTKHTDPTAHRHISCLMSPLCGWN